MEKPFIHRSRFSGALIFIFIALISCRKDKADCTSLSGTSLTFNDVTYSYNLDGTLDYLNTSTNPKSEVKYTYENGKIAKIDEQVDGGLYYSESKFSWTDNHATLEFRQEGSGPDPTFTEIELNANGYLEKFGAMSLYYNTNKLIDSIIDNRVGRKQFYLFNYEGDKLNEVLVSSLITDELTRQYRFSYTEEGLLYKYKFIANPSAIYECTYSYNESGQLTYATLSDGARYSVDQTGCGGLINMDPVNFWRYYHLDLPVIGRFWH